MRYALICLLLAGCAAQVTSSSGRTVVVKAAVPDTGVDSALALANTECGKSGLSARVQIIPTPYTDQYIFECVKVDN